MIRETFIGLCFAAVSLPSLAADSNPRRQDAPSELVDFFQAIDAGKIEVRFIPRDAAAANVLISNKTDQTLQVRLPDTFAALPVATARQAPGARHTLGAMQPAANPAAIQNPKPPAFPGLAALQQPANPVLGQLLGGQGFGNQGAGAGGGGGTQGVGGGFNQGQGQGQGNQGNFGFGGQRQGQGFGGFRIPPEKLRKLKVTTVCLEHGKPEPNAKVEYRIVPLAQFRDDDRIAALCRRLASGQTSQNTAQAAAWHLSNKLSWNDLSKLNRIESRYRGNIRQFTSSELGDAKRLVAHIEGTTADRYSEGTYSENEYRSED